MIEDTYKLGKKIGGGAFGTVHECIDVISG
jgi:hypothetical protein